MNQEKLKRVIEKEKQRHNKIMKKIKEAKTKEELPYVSDSKITNFLSTYSKFDNKSIKPSEFIYVIQSVIDCGFFASKDVKEIYIRVLKENYPEKNEEEYEERYNDILKIGAVENYIFEMSERAKKLYDFECEEDLENHKKIMKQIEDAFEKSDLPKVSRGDFNKLIQKLIQNSYTDKFGMSELQQLCDVVFDEKDEKVIQYEIWNFCNNQDLSDEEKEVMYMEIETEIFGNDKVKYIVEELKAKEKRILKIYEMDHEETMEHIKNAQRISQLPPNLSKSTLSAYLKGNTIIYPKSNKYSTQVLTRLTELLLEGKDFDSKEVNCEIEKLAEMKYPKKKEEATALLKEKLSKLPKTKYLVEEINYAQERQVEFIGRNCSNVNVYFIPNPNTPEDGGKFYNCYISRAQNLDLGEILSLDLDAIVPEGMDIDAVEWYIQQNYDETFKTAGGIILQRDESIGNVNVFKPSDGKIGITPEEKNKYDEIAELGKQVKSIIKSKNEKADKFRELQAKYLEYQAETDKQLSELEFKIDQLLEDKSKDTDDEQK